jgi:hypothetical protein
VNPAWWAAFGPAEAQLRCGDTRHRLRWADGTLQAVDHPDAEGELVLGALGGDTSPCLDMVAAWGKHSDDLTVLAIGPRSASDQLTIPASVLDEITAASGGGQAYHGLGNPAAHAVSVGGTISLHTPLARTRTVDLRQPVRQVRAGHGSAGLAGPRLDKAGAGPNPRTWQRAGAPPASDPGAQGRRQSARPARKVFQGARLERVRPGWPAHAPSWRLGPPGG